MSVFHSLILIDWIMRETVEGNNMGKRCMMNRALCMTLLNLEIQYHIYPGVAVSACIDNIFHLY